MNFPDYLESKTIGTQLCLNFYMGIKKQEQPKWLGWKELQRLKSQNEPLKSDYLDDLVYNFYLCDFLINRFYIE